MGRRLWAGAGVVWFAATVAGFAWLAVYANTPGAPARPDRRWPGASRIVLDDSRPTLVMLAHPRCTCTRASLAELTEVMARATSRPRAYVIFIKPGGSGVDWERTDLWRTAAAIPDVTVLRDDDGVEATRFGAETSGQTLLYGRDGTLLFSGGTTGARGHAGDNLGRAAILEILNHPEHARAAVAQPATSSVFGCSLFNGPDAGREIHSSEHEAHER
jgi:hypothetical protein